MVRSQSPDSELAGETPESPKAAAAPKSESDSAINEAEGGHETTAEPDVLYHAKCLEAESEVKVFYSEKPFSGLNLHGLHQVKPTSLIEVVFEVKGKDVKDSRESDKYKRYNLESSAKFGVDGDFIPDSVGTPTLHIHSKHLRDELRRIVPYYPSQNLNGDTILIEHPYPMLMHYISELKDAKSTYGEDVRSVVSESIDQTKAESNEKAHALTVLLDYLMPIYAKEVETGAARQKLAVPMITYSMLWFLFKPGTDVYIKVGSKWRIFVVMSVEEKKQKEEQMPRFYLPRPATQKVDKWRIQVWSLVFDGKRLYRRGRKFHIEKFYGEREISALSIVPCEVYDKLNGTGRRQQLEKRGEVYYELLKDLPRHFNYSGIAIAKIEKTQPWDEPLKRVVDYAGDVVIDPASYKKHGPLLREGFSYYRQKETKRIPEDDGDTDGENEEETGPGGEPEAFGGGPHWETYNDIVPTEREELTQHQRLLLPADIRGFALKLKLWMAFDASKLHEIEFPKKGEGAIENLILDKLDIEYLKALSFKTSKSTSHVDFIKGKGEGQIFLFHGPPGTGKTYTVEAIAQYTNRPLLSLTVADLGLTEEKLEAQMTKWFQVATHWGAVLLIDEADVFLEKRKGSEVGRNSLVSLFLRSMEYYSGLLFLTTNRPGAIDDAFRSRIHSAINFPSFNNDKSARLWELFLDKVKKENPNIKITSSAKRFLSTDKTVKKMEWSGREIRNAFSLALTLARYAHETENGKEGDDEDEIEVRKEHFEDVVIRRDEFIKYIDSIREMKEDERAYEVGDRRDATLDADSD